MKKTPLVSFFLSLIVFSAFSHADVMDKIVQSIRTSNHKELSTFFDEQVKVEILNKENTMSKTQAETAMSDFFKKFPVTDFSVLHKGKSNSNAQFSIGTYTSGEKTFRVYIYMKQGTNSLVIKEFRIEEE